MTFKKEVQLLTLLILVLLLAMSFENTGKNKKDIVYINEYRYNRDMKRLQVIVDNTSADGVIVYDTSADIILGGKNLEKTYSLASLTKIVTAVMVYEKDKNLLNDIRGMLKTSDNKQAELLAKTFGHDELAQTANMNRFTKRFGGLYFRNVSGLDLILSTSTDERLPGGLGKPAPLAKFIKEYYFKYPELFDQTLVTQNNTNLIVNQLSFLNGGKTGFTNLSGGNLLVSIQKGLDRQIFIIILNSTEKNRFVDIQNIANFLLQSSI